jgi:hypothetical protein
MYWLIFKARLLNKIDSAGHTEAITSAPADRTVTDDTLAAAVATSAALHEEYQDAKLTGAWKNERQMPLTPLSLTTWLTARHATLILVAEQTKNLRLMKADSKAKTILLNSLTGIAGLLIEDC